MCVCVVRVETHDLSSAQECADAGWWMGEIGGRQGVFPDNFVKLLEVEKEVIMSSGQTVCVYRTSRGLGKSHGRDGFLTCCFLMFLRLCAFPETQEAAAPERTFSQKHHR